jgi:hypothetical protein
VVFGRKWRVPSFRPTSVRALQDRFRADHFEKKQIPRGDQAKTLVSLLDLYAEHNLFPQDRIRPLCVVCPNKDDCWARGRGSRRRSRDEDGAICLPWVGRDYGPQGVVTIGINPNISERNGRTDLLIEHAITWDWHIDGLDRGLRANKGSRFAYGAMRSAAGLLDLIDGKPIRDRDPRNDDDAQQLVHAVHRTARLQAIKCVPVRKDSEPLTAMWRNCPGFLLADELKLVRPGHLLVLGTNAKNAVTSLGRIHAGRLELDDWSCAIHFVAHPRTGSASEAALLTSLTRKPRKPTNR